jgi:hypothetical protein
VDDDETDGGCSTCNGLGLANVIDPIDGALVMDDCPECGGESYTQSPAVSPPSVVAVSDAERDAIAVSIQGRNRHTDLPTARFWVEQVLREVESFAQRMGSGERDAARGRFVCRHFEVSAARRGFHDLLYVRDSHDPTVATEQWLDAAITQQNKRGGA